MSQEPSDTQDPFNTKRPEVYELKGLQWLLFYPVAWFIRLYFRTWRFKMPEGAASIIRDTPRPRLIVVWHNRSLVCSAWMFRYLEAAKIGCLISPSRMAAWEVAFFHFLGFQVIRGSTTRRSVQAGIEILRCMRKDGDAGIAPDGPSGPLYSFQEGAVALARKAGASLLLFMPNVRAAYRTRTWDRHLVPLPFATIKVNLRCVEPSDPIWEKSDPEVAEELRRVCLEVTEDPFKL